MKRPWFRQSRGIAANTGYQLLSVEGVLAYHTACLHADDEGIFWSAGNRDVLDTLAGLLVARRPAIGPGWAKAAAREPADLNLFDVSEDGTLLRIAEWVADAPPAGAPEPRRAPPSADEVASAATARRAPGRPRKGALPMCLFERTWRRRFEKRSGMFHDAVPGSTFEAWLAAHPEAATKLDQARNETLQQNPVAATKPCNETLQRNPVEGRAGSETSEVVGSSEEQKRAEEEAESGARDAQRNPAAAATKLCNETPVVASTGFVATAPGARLPHGETLSAVDPADLFARLQAVVTVHGTVRVFLRGGDSSEARFVEFIRSLVVRQVATLDQVVAAFAFGAQETWVATARRRVDLARMLKDDGALLLEWLRESQREPADPSQPELRDGEDAVIARARAAYRNAPLAPGEAP